MTSTTIGLQLSGKASKAFINENAQSSGSHKYWRLVFHGDQSSLTNLGFWQVADIALLDSADNLITDYGATDLYFLKGYHYDFFSPYDPNNPQSAATAFYGQVDPPGAGNWGLSFQPNIETRHIEVELGGVGDVHNYEITIITEDQDDTKPAEGAPTSWLLQYSDDGVTWNTRAREDDYVWVTGEPRTQSFNAVPTITGNIELSEFTLTGEAVNNYQEAVIFAELPSLEVVGQADNTVIDLPALTMEGELSPGSVLSTFLPIELPAFIATGELAPGQFSTFDAELPELSMLAEGYQYGDLVGWVLPELVMTGESVRGTTGPIDIDLPAFELTAVGFDDSVTPSTLPEFTLVAEGIGGQVAVMFETLPWFELTGTAFNGTDQATSLPELEMTGTGVAGQPGDAYLYLSALTMDAEGYSGDAPTEQGTAVIETDLPMIELEAQGIAGNVYEGGGALQSLVLAAEGVTGQLGSVDITLPALELDASGSVEQFAAVNIDLPMIRLTGTATNPVTADTTATAVDAITGITMNVLNRALSTRAGLSFNSMTEFNGVTLAASSEGLFVMTGDTDHGEIIEASVRLGKHDFDVPQLKTIADCYVGYSASGALELTACADDGQEYCYPLRPRKSDRHTSRSKLGRGLKGRYIQLGIDNVLGSDFMIDNMEPKPRVMKRQVK